MHTFQQKNTHFHFNSDLSGDVRIVHQGTTGREDAHIPGEALLAFLADYVRNRRIRMLEDASDAEVLGLGQDTMG